MPSRRKFTVRLSSCRGEAWVDAKSYNDAIGIAVTAVVTSQAGKADVIELLEPGKGKALLWVMWQGATGHGYQVGLYPPTRPPK